MMMITFTDTYILYIMTSLPVYTVHDINNFVYNTYVYYAYQAPKQALS